MFNRWRKYPRRKPKKVGNYLCTIRWGENLENTKVMDLFFDTLDGGQWVDDRRANVFDGYKVYPIGKLPDEDNRVFCDSLCERDFVVAWKKLPRGYKEKRKRK